MNFSEDWKSLWPISSVYSPPLLLHGPSAKPLGPLFFSPSPKSRTLLFSSPSLLPPPLPPSFKSLRTLSHPSEDVFIPPSLISSLLPESNDATTPIFNNNLQILRFSKKSYFLFFPTGENWDQIGCLKLSLKGANPEVSTDRGDQLFAPKEQFFSRILGISVSSFDFDLISGNSVTIGSLSAFTLYAVHWYRVEISKLGSELEVPVFVYLGTQQFNNVVIHACWNPHLPEESLVLLENGELYFYELEDCPKATEFPTKLKGTKIKFIGEDFDRSGGKGGWVSCDFSWHPRIFIVCCSSAVYLIDWRFGEGNMSTVAQMDIFVLHHSLRNERFISFCKAGSDGFYFSVATENHLFLLDIRKAMMPLLQWTHGLDNPLYINVFALSQLRSTMEKDKYRWASDSGFAILLGSFLSGEFNLFCYGPPSPVPYGSVASKVLNFANSLYAWELPSEISLLGDNCRCGDCLLREDFFRAVIPQSRKERILGFCILSEALFDPQPESNAVGGFTLIRMVSSGKLESQKYRASWDFFSQKVEESREECLSRYEGHLLYLSEDQKYKFTRRFRYLSLDYLLGYMNGDLSKVLSSKVRNLHVDPSKTISFPQDRCKLICDMLEAHGIDSTGSPPEIVKVINDIRWPMSIHEVTSSRIWAGLGMDLLQLAFSPCSEVLDVLVDHRKINVDFIDVPNVPQLPPFFQKKPLSRSNILSRKMQLRDSQGNALVGPLLPLPLLLTLREVDTENYLVSNDEANRFSAEEELTHQCNVVMKAANDMASSEPFPDSKISCTVSLANDGEEKWVGSQETMSLFFYKPSTASGKNKSNVELLQENPVYQNDKFDTFISRRHEKGFTSKPMEEPVGIEEFNKLCPIELNFDFPHMKFEPKESKAYKKLFQRLSKWQKGCKQYQDFLHSNKIQETEKVATPTTWI